MWWSGWNGSGRNVTDTELKVYQIVIKSTLEIAFTLKLELMLSTRIISIRLFDDLG